MFNKNSYLLPQGNINPLSHHASTSVLGDEIFFHHHGDDMFSGHYLVGGDANPVVDAAASASAFFSHQGGLINGDPSAMVNSFPRAAAAAAAAKKDRHSKIYTAQGPRDRRVRLSIGVARRFFDLQEILGFDKPSKTLDWLLTKSKTAIQDLEQSSKKSAVSSSPSDEVDSSDILRPDSKRKLVEMNHKHKDSSKQAPDLAKESRAKARARARERTREKMCIKKLNESCSNNGGGGYYDDTMIPIQYMNNQQFEFCHPSYEDLIQQESILIKRKVKQYPGFQHQNVFISSSNYAVPSPAADNWDISTSFAASQSNICAILDQHKFFNSTSNN